MLDGRHRAVSRERALGLLQEWTEVLSGQPGTDDAIATTPRIAAETRARRPRRIGVPKAKRVAAPLR